MNLATLDIAVIGAYGIFIFGLAQWVSSRKTETGPRNSSDYFLASRSLPWWAIGASLIAANISAEQIVGMSGSGYAMGLAIASIMAISRSHSEGDRKPPSAKISASSVGKR